MFFQLKCLTSSISWTFSWQKLIISSEFQISDSSSMLYQFQSCFYPTSRHHASWLLLYVGSNPEYFSECHFYRSLAFNDERDWIEVDENINQSFKMETQSERLVSTEIFLCDFRASTSDSKNFRLFFMTNFWSKSHKILTKIWMWNIGIKRSSKWLSVTHSNKSVTAYKFPSKS